MRMLKLFSLPIARLHSGGRHESIGSSLVHVYYPDNQGIDTMLIDIQNFIIAQHTYENIRYGYRFLWSLYVILPKCS